jgi:hypothetical protein
LLPECITSVNKNWTLRLYVTIFLCNDPFLIYIWLINKKFVECTNFANLKWGMLFERWQCIWPCISISIFYTLKFECNSKTQYLTTKFWCSNIISLLKLMIWLACTTINIKLGICWYKTWSWWEYTDNRVWEFEIY